jgi:hypothetical protein
MSSFAQDDSYIKGRWTVNLGIVPDVEYFSHGFYPRHQAMLSAHYGFDKFLEIGSYCGISKYLYQNEDLTYMGIRNKILYGLSAKAHLLPLVFDAQDFRFDLYVNTRAGIDHFCGANSQYQKNRLRFHGGAGLAFYPFKHLGAFTEFGYDNHEIIDYQYNWNWECGVVYKFRRKR